MAGLSDLPELLLRAICEDGGHQEGAVVDVRPLLSRLGIPPRELFAAVMTLEDRGMLQYLGAGPIVRVTALGATHCGHRGWDPGNTAP